ncbi:Putative adhesin [Micromonospora nigra]|uniref:Putative adhesin n=1 Tax=Micromonospora nigra TaxID=145857 RepID=A0A1C6RJY6_9ACTN|nr:DUF4097 family beta strand repeat-containing protein [Micromonospora nigra]SCL17362.1 Putative adhesin [Micromonospora nigra]
MALHRIVAATAATAALIVLAGCDNLSFRQLDFDTVEPVKVTSVRVLPGAGDVVVRASGDPAEVRVKRSLRYQGTQPDATYEVTGGELVLDTDCGNLCSISYEVTVGAGVAVEGESGAGNVDLSGVGAVQLRVGSGNVRIAGAGGAVRVETGSGYIEVYDVAAPVTLRASSGNVTATRIAGRVDAEASSGHVTVELDQPNSVRAHASSGDVEVTVPAAAYQVRSEAGSGDVELGVLHRLGAPLVLDVATGSGDIRVIQR